MLGINWSTSVLLVVFTSFPPSNIELWGGGGWRLQKNLEGMITNELKDEKLNCSKKFGHDCWYNSDFM